MKYFILIAVLLALCALPATGCADYDRDYGSGREVGEKKTTVQWST